MVSLCPECGSENHFFDSFGEQVCRSCGLVLEETVFEKQVVNDSLKSKGTIPFLLTAGSKGKEGKIFKSPWLLSTREKSFAAGISMIDSLGSKLCLSDFVIKESKFFFKKSLYSDLGVGRDNFSLIYASVYLACIMQGVPKTLCELTVYDDVEEKNVMKAFRLIKKKFDIRTVPIDSLDLLPRFASKLKLKCETEFHVRELLVKLKGTQVVGGRKPETVLAGAIYFVCKQDNDPRTQRQIANCVGVIEITIRKVCKKITSFTLCC